MFVYSRRELRSQAFLNKQRITATSNKLQNHQFIGEIGVTGKTTTGTVQTVLVGSFLP